MLLAHARGTLKWSQVYTDDTKAMGFVPTPGSSSRPTSDPFADAGFSQAHRKDVSAGATTVYVDQARAQRAATEFARPSAGLETYHAVKAFHASRPDEISLTKAQRVGLVKAYPDGWAQIQVSDGRRGMVPFKRLQQDHPL